MGRTEDKTLTLCQFFANIVAYSKIKKIGTADFVCPYTTGARKYGYQGRTIQIMKRTFKRIVSRGVAAVFLAALMLSLALGGTTTVDVANEEELKTALSDAVVNSADSYLIVCTASITVTSGVNIPSNATISNTGFELSFTSGTVSLSGTIVDGTVSVSGTSAILAVYGSLASPTTVSSSGTLVRMTGCSITSSVNATGTGEIRYETQLSLENLDPASTETIQTITYSGIADADDDATFVKDHSVWGYVYPLCDSSGNKLTITKVTTDAGNIFRLGTRNTGVLSLEYTVGYYGTTDATFTTANPTSYTSSDSAIQLNNPTKDGYTFDGWTCDQLSLTVPTLSAVIPEGMSGALTFIANWTQTTMPSGGGQTGGGSGGSTGSVSSSSSTTTEEEDTTEDEAATEVATNDTSSTGSARVGQGTSSTKVTFTSDVDEVIPTIESVQGNSFPWGWTLLGVGGSAILVYVIALINRKMRERADVKK